MKILLYPKEVNRFCIITKNENVNTD